MTRLSSPTQHGPEYWRDLHLKSDRAKPVFFADRRRRQPTGTAKLFYQRGRSEPGAME